MTPIHVKRIVAILKDITEELYPVPGEPGSHVAVARFDATPEQFTPWFRMEWTVLAEEYSDALSHYIDPT